MPQHICGPQRTTSGKQFFLSTKLARVRSFFPWMWVLEIGLKWSCLAAGTSTCWAISPAPRNNRSLWVAVTTDLIVMGKSRNHFEIYRPWVNKWRTVHIVYGIACIYCIVERSRTLHKYPRSRDCKQAGGQFFIYTSIAFASVFSGESENSCALGLRVAMSMKTTRQKGIWRNWWDGLPGKAACWQT